VDPNTGETCEPPNTATCDSQCHKIVVPVCGNGTIEGTEQCDDGNKLNLDGCDSNCKYEAVARMTSVQIVGTAAPAFCTPATNHLGSQVLTSTALSNLNGTLTTDVNNGTTNVLTYFMGLDDLTGVSDPALTIGIVSGILDPAKGAWPGNNPIDWWFLGAYSTINPLTGLPTGVLTNGSLAARNLKGGPSDVSLQLILGGSPALLEMRSAQIQATINGSPPPNVPAPPPAKLANGLTVFQTITGNGTGQGLCGNITVESLAQIPIPQVLTTGTTACVSCGATSHTYTYCGMGMPVGSGCNSLLDALVGGCQQFLCLVTSINPSEPDVPAGATVKNLTLGANNKVPTTQTTGNKDAYSSYLSFTANRSHLTGETCSVTTDCQSGKTCNNGTCQ
jgi:cysteine-rich repeat protein